MSDPSSSPSSSPSSALTGSPSDAAAILRNRKKGFVVKQLPTDGQSANDDIDDPLSFSEPAAAAVPATSSQKSERSESNFSKLKASASIEPKVTAATSESAIPPNRAAASVDASPLSSSSSSFSSSSAATAALPASDAAEAAAAAAAATGAPVRLRRPGANDSSPDLLLLFLFAFLLFGSFFLFLFSDSFIDSSHRLMGGGGGGRKMHDTTFKLVVSLEAAYRGEVVQSEFPQGGRQIRCPHCSGTGAEGGESGVKRCGECEGKGQKVGKRQIMPGFFQEFRQTSVETEGEQEAVGWL